MNELNKRLKSSRFFHSEMNFMNKILINNFNFTSLYDLFQF
ncbi:hypothetical protein QF042_001781 [Pedobacter sp. W3I1]|nr:hypothetical protein [Pedobacter sp. W3I1]